MVGLKETNCFLLYVVHQFHRWIIFSSICIFNAHTISGDIVAIFKNHVKLFFFYKIVAIFEKRVTNSEFDVEQNSILYNQCHEKCDDLNFTLDVRDCVWIIHFESKTRKKKKTFVQNYLVKPRQEHVNTLTLTHSTADGSMKCNLQSGIWNSKNGCFLNY